MNSWIEMLGVMVWPLMFCSLMMLALILERLFFFSSRIGFSKSELKSILIRTKAKQWLELQEILKPSKSQLAKGVKKMLSCQHLPAKTIEDISSLWLVEQKTLLHVNLAWLTLLAVVSPLLGLLGTVLGMIDAFQAMASHTGAVSPAVLANGLQQAMLTTAFGLCIAIPSLISGHAFRIWANHRLLCLESLLNHMLLSFQNIDITEPDLSSVNEETASLLQEQQA